MQTNAIRETFLDYFSSKEHLVMPSFSLVPQNDPTLLLIGAGMAPLKPFFTGEKKPPHPRVATCQKCVRTPDIERVGHTGRHATFFEMLGNFSFGDYFKEEAIAWAWDLVLNGYRLPQDKLWVSIYEEDDEAFKIWNENIGVPPDRIKRLGKKDNFWEIGLGPCGPCSEIYFDLGPQVGCNSADCAVGCDCDRYLEIWNLVFTQFSREADGSLVELDQKNIDTGAGLERVAMALQGVSSFYETDLVKPLYSHFAGLADEVRRRANEIPLRIVTEHCRGTTMLVADGVIPSNEGRGYVLRRLLRRAVRYGRLLGIENDFLSDAVSLVVEAMAPAYPDLKEKEDYLRQVINLEEKRFRETLAQGMEILDEYMEKLKNSGDTVLEGGLAFKLYDTYGFPLDLTAEILAENGFEVDRQTFSENLRQQQERARAARLPSGEESSARYREAEPFSTLFTGYETLEQDTTVDLILAEGRSIEKAGKGEQVEVLLAETPFYAEAGGQIGDTGLIAGDHGKVKINNTVFTPWGQIVHQGEIIEGSINNGDRVKARVDGGRRQAICRSHTSTHLLHKALRDQLGEHVNQAGSLVAPDRLRFDFNHFSALAPEELKAIEERVNAMILANANVSTGMTTLEEAKMAGAAALFADKYEEKVRMVSAGEFSRELCGGTHVGATGEIGSLRIISEESIGSGMRRLEAVTGMGAYRYAVEQSDLLDRTAHILNSSTDRIEGRASELASELRVLQKANSEFKQKLAAYEVDSLISAVQDVQGVKVISASVQADSPDALRITMDELRSRIGSAVIVLGAVSDGKVMLVGSVSEDLLAKGVKANDLIKTVARQVGGGGGGRPDLAQAGGKDPSALPGALDMVQQLVREQLPG